MLHCRALIQSTIVTNDALNGEAMKDDLIPSELVAKLDADTAAEVLRFSRSVAEILSDNKLPFFPNYTDHGLKHINRLLSTITTRLIPKTTSLSSQPLMPQSWRLPHSCMISQCT